MKNTLVVILLTVLAIGILITISYKENDMRTLPAYKTSSIRGFHLTHKEGDKIKWELISDNATFPEGSKEIILNDLTMKVHQEYEIALKGGSGVYNIRDKNLIINKPIEINIGEAVLTTDSLTWNGEKGLISTDEPIKFKGKNFIIEGTGLSATTQTQQIKILENVKGIFYH